MPTNIKLLVKSPSAPSVEILRFVASQKQALSSNNVYVRADKIVEDEIDEELIGELRARGITKLPAAIMPSGDVYMGAGEIKKALSGLMSKVRRTTMSAPISDVSDYMRGEMYKGVKRGKEGLHVEDKDTDDSFGGESTDFNKLMQDYNRNVPKHRRTGGEDFDDEPPVRRDRRGGAPSRPQPVRAETRDNVNYREYMDEYDDRDTEETPGFNISDYTNTVDNEMDAKIMEAMLMNGGD